MQFKARVQTQYVWGKDEVTHWITFHRKGKRERPCLGGEGMWVGGGGWFKDFSKWLWGQTLLTPNDMVQTVVVGRWKDWKLGELIYICQMT